VVGWHQLGKFRRKNLTKTRDRLGSYLQVVTAPFSRFFVKTTPNCCLTGVVTLFCVQSDHVVRLFSALAIYSIAGEATFLVAFTLAENALPLRV
jgi:hypothetical protein